MKAPLTSKDRARAAILFAGLFALFSLLIFQFFTVQIIEGEKWSELALSQHQMVLKEPARRGIFYSNPSVCEGHLEMPRALVRDVPKFHLYCDPLSIPAMHRKEVAKKMAEFSQKISPKKVEEILEKKSRSRRVLKWLPKELRTEIESWWYPFAKQNRIPRNALYFVLDYQRSYPFGSLLGQVLHTVREEKDAETNQVIPTGGLELIFNSHLQGSPGKRIIRRSPKHALDSGKVLLSPEPGADVYLTLDHYLQAVAEEAIRKGVENAKARAGWAVLMEPYTGEIWALAQYPFFDPSQYKKYYKTEELAENTKVKAVTDCYEPGSIFKPCILALCLKANQELLARGEAPLFNPDEKMPTHDGRVPGRSHKPIRDLRFYKFMNMDIAVQKSGNIYVVRVVERLIERMGEKWFRDQLQEVFQIGLKTGIELPCESPGMLPTPGKLHPNGTLEWSVPTPYSLAIGYNLMVNSMHMLRAYAIFANGGFDVTPTLLKKIVKKRGEKEDILLDNNYLRTSKLRKRVLDAEICDRMIRSLKFSTKQGTCTRAELWGYTEAGKSGTAEKVLQGAYSKKDHTSFFVGLAPASNPRFVILVGIDDPEYRINAQGVRNQMGGACAAPVFQEIASKALLYLGVEEDDPHGFPKNDPRYDPRLADWIQETEELMRLSKKWNE